MATSEMAMLNVRMDRETRERGNAALAELGYTASQYVRSLWEHLAKDDWHETREQVSRAMAPVRTPEQQAEIDRKLAAMDRLDESYQRFIDTYGFDTSRHVSLTDDKDEIAEARYAYLQEKWGEA